MFIFSFHLSLTICIHKSHHALRTTCIYHTSLSRFNIVWSFFFLDHICFIIIYAFAKRLKMLTHRFFVSFSSVSTHLKWLKLLFNLFPLNIFHNKIRLASNCDIFFNLVWIPLDMVCWGIWYTYIHTHNRWVRFRWAQYLHNSYETIDRYG